jgi:hypothetical protein
MFIKVRIKELSFNALQTMTYKNKDVYIPQCTSRAKTDFEQSHAGSSYATNRR